ncbi:9412_t:CDS:2, partial [Funneliformis geosporum]
HQNRINSGLVNRFYGSLKYLRNMKNLKQLGIGNTNIDSGLEYLAESDDFLGKKKEELVTLANSIKEKLDRSLHGYLEIFLDAQTGSNAIEIIKKSLHNKTDEKELNQLSAIKAEIIQLEKQLTNLQNQSQQQIQVAQIIQKSLAAYQAQEISLNPSERDKFAPKREITVRFSLNPDLLNFYYSLPAGQRTAIVEESLRQEKRNRSDEFSQKQEYQKYLEELSLPENTTPLEQAKYEICRQVVSYKLDTKISTEELAQKIQLSKAETEDILYYRIDYFTLDRLMDYTNKLFSPCEVKITIEKKELGKNTHARVI